MPTSTVFKPGRFFLFGAFVILAIIAADQYTKWLVLETMLRADGAMRDFWAWFITPQPVAFFLDQQENFNTVTLAPFLDFVMVWNKGISFGLFHGESQGLKLTLIGISLLISMVMLIWLAVARHRSTAWGLSIIVGGAIANVLDRIRFGAVADFIDVHVGEYHWPAFNLADACISVGAVILVFASVWTNETDEKRA